MHPNVSRNLQGVDITHIFGKGAFLELYAVTAKHWSTLFETGSHFIFLNSFS